jgi:preprotein translocase subunit SecG
MALFAAILLVILGFILIFLVLIQKGRGGGLAGAFGGPGGSSAFGSRTGERITWVTIIAASIWLLLIMITVKATQPLPRASTAPAASQVPPQDLPPEPTPEG